VVLGKQDFPCFVLVDLALNITKELIMKTISILLFVIISSHVNCQSWKEMMDSTNSYQKKQDFETALLWAKLALPKAEKEFGKGDSNYASTLVSISEIFYYQGNLDSAIYYGKIAVSIWRTIFKGYHPDLATSIHNMAYFYKERGNYKEAKPLFIEALEMRRHIYKTDHPILANSINNLANFYYDMEDVNNAVPLFIEALKMRRSIYKTDHPYLASSINSLALIFHDKGDFINAKPLYIEALEMYRSLYKTDHPDLAASMHNMAKIFKDLGDFSKAEPLFIEALEMNRRLFKTDNPRLAYNINSLALFYQEQGDFSKAEPLFIEALEMRRRMFKTDHPDLSASMNNMARIFEDLGYFRKAEPLFIEALEMDRRLFITDNPGLAKTINNMGAFYAEMGNISKAEPLFIESLEMSRRLFKTDNLQLASSINNLATFYAKIKDFGKAEKLYIEALEMYRRLCKTDHLDLANIINNMGTFYYEIDDFSKVEPLLMEALEMRRRIFKTDHPNLAKSINNLAIFYIERNELNKAEKLNIEALDMYRRLFKTDHPLIANCIHGLATINSRKGDFNKAEQLYIKVLEMFKNIFSLQSSNLSEKEKEQFWNTMKNDFETFNSFALKRSIENNKIINNMYDNQLIIKGLLLNSSLKVKNRILNSDDSILTRKYEDWQFLKNNIAKLQTQTQQELVKNGISLDSIINEANDIEKELSSLSEDFKKEYEKKELKWLDVQSTLKENEAAIEIVRFRHFNSKLTDSVYYSALIIKKNSELPELVVITNGNEFESKYISEYRQQIEQQKKAIHDPEKIQSKLEDLYNQFWAPIQEKLKGIKTVYLSLDGIYNQINLNTLINPKTKKYLLDELDFRIVTSTRDLASKSQTLTGSQSLTNNTAELFGDPQFNLDSTKYLEVASRYIAERSASQTLTGSQNLTNMFDSLSRQGISSLPGTRKEIEKIASNMKANNWTVNTYLGAEALEEAIKSVKSPRVLHIATHGKFLKDVEIKEERSFGTESQRYVENPLLRSMLLFAGAGNTITPPQSKGEGGSLPPLLTKERGPGGEVLEDGLLTAYEAMNLNLDNTELVVLSACETGLGEIKNGEGVYGLQRAFQVAGAKSLIMSLWSVSDAATQELMTSFYDKWLSGKTKREAFREAQMELKKKYPGFYYWGAFVMVGE
jgi:CHAT domain-containing protein/Tfp pilus assembly protein PilF